jgi:hypothetical protein
VIPGGLDRPAETEDDAETLLADLLDSEVTHRVHDDGAVTVTYEDATAWLRARTHAARRRSMDRHPSNR